MKKKYIIMMLGILLVAGVIAQVVISNIKPDVSKETIQRLIDCGYSAKYKITDEVTQGDKTNFIIEFDNGKKVRGFLKDNSGDIEEQIQNATINAFNYLLLKCDTNSKEQNKYNIPDDWIDLEK